MFPQSVADSERQSGSESYLDILTRVHAELQPDAYLEIGVRHGRSLALAQCPAIGIDPAPEITTPLAATTQVLAMTSDAYFATRSKSDNGIVPDLVFIDGMHLFEYALRDFLNVERFAKPTTLVVIDDIFPNHPRQADRERTTRVWTGDVWKLLLLFRQHFTDLLFLPVNTYPTGLLLVAGLDPDRNITDEGYQRLCAAFKGDLNPPTEILERHANVDTSDPVIAGYAKRLSKLRRLQASNSEVRSVLQSLAF